MITMKTAWKIVTHREGAGSYFNHQDIQQQNSFKTQIKRKG